MSATTDTRGTAREKLPGRFFGWLGGAFLSQMGDAVLYFAIGWAAAAHGGVWAGIALSAIVLPRTVLMLVGGTISDRRSARSVLIGAVTVMLSACVVFAAVTLAIGVPLWLLIVFGLVIGTVDAFFLPSMSSMPRLLVGGALLPRALGMRETGTQVVKLLGAPVGGFLVAWVGMAGVSLVDAATFAAMLCILVAIRPTVPENPSKKDGTVLSDAADGVRLVLRHRVLRPGLLLTAVVASAAIPVPTLLVPLLAHDLGLPASAAGFIVGGEAVGSIVVAVAVSKFGAFSRPGLVAPVSLVIIAVGVGILASASSLPLLVGAATISGLGLGLFISHIGPLLLGSSPDEHISRVQAVIGLAQSGALLLTNNVLGVLAQTTSPEYSAWLCAALLIVAAIGATASRPFRTSTLAGIR